MGQLDAAEVLTAREAEAEAWRGAAAATEPREQAHPQQARS